MGTYRGRASNTSGVGQDGFGDRASGTLGRASTAMAARGTARGGASTYRGRTPDNTGDLQPFEDDEKLFKKMTRNAQFHTHNSFMKKKIHHDEDSLELWPKILTKLNTHRNKTVDDNS